MVFSREETVRHWNKLLKVIKILLCKIINPIQYKTKFFYTNVLFILCIRMTFNIISDQVVKSSSRQKDSKTLTTYSGFLYCLLELFEIGVVELYLLFYVFRCRFPFLLIHSYNDPQSHHQSTIIVHKDLQQFVIRLLVLYGLFYLIFRLQIWCSPLRPKLTHVHTEVNDLSKHFVLKDVYLKSHHKIPSLLLYSKPQSV